jgi:hypothetical protein
MISVFLRPSPNYLFSTWIQRKVLKTSKVIRRENAGLYGENHVLHVTGGCLRLQSASRGTLILAIKVKVNMSVCLVKHYAMKTYLEVGDYLHVFLTFALDGGK